MAARTPHTLSTLLGALGFLTLTLGGAPPRADVTEGATLRIWDISSTDAWYPHRARLIDMECTAGAGGVHPNDGVWFDGKVTCTDGLEYVFYQFTFELRPSVAVADSACPAGAYVGGQLPHGSTVRILGLSTEDAYFDVRDTVVGLRGTVDGGLQPQRGLGGCWFGGGFVSEGGDDYYFYEVAVAADAIASSPGSPECAPGVFTGARLENGRRVKIVDIHPDDAYYDTRFSVIGVTGAVSGDLHNNEGCWFGGGFVADDGTDFYFYRASVATVDGAVPTSGDGRHTGSVVTTGTALTILDIHPDDAYYGSHADILGKDCTATGEMDAMDPGWFAGPVTCADGSEYYFFKAAVKLK
jgi:hypothetical protein